MDDEDYANNNVDDSSMESNSKDSTMGNNEDSTSDSGDEDSTSASQHSGKTTDSASANNEEASTLNASTNPLSKECVAMINATAAKGDLEKFKAILAKHEHDVEAEDEHGMTTLLYSAQCRANADCLRFLLQQDEMRVNTKTTSGLTPLMISATSRSVVCVQELLNHQHINIDAVYHTNKTALMMASDRIMACYDEYGKEVLPYNKFDIEICKILIEKGADVNIRDKKGHLLLHRACKAAAAASLVELLVPRTKYEAEAEAKLQFSPMQLAISCKNYASLKALVKFTNQTDFVRPNKETYKVHHDFYPWDGVPMSNLAFLIRQLHFCWRPPQMVMVEEMVNLGWKLNQGPDDERRSAIFAFCGALGFERHDDEYFKELIKKGVSYPFLNLFLRKGAFIKPSEAKELIEMFCDSDYFNAFQLKYLTETGLIVPETFLEANFRVGFSDTPHAALRAVQPGVALILILNGNFGNQGSCAQKIQAILDFETDYEKKYVEMEFHPFQRDNTQFHNFKKEALATITNELRIGNLQAQTRAVIRRRLIDQGYYHPWQMKDALEPLLGGSVLLNFVLYSKVEDWSSIYPIIERKWKHRYE